MVPKGAPKYNEKNTDPKNFRLGADMDTPKISAFGAGKNRTLVVRSPIKLLESAKISSAGGVQV